MLEEQERAKKLEDERYEQSLKERALRVSQCGLASTSSSTSHSVPTFSHLQCFLCFPPGFDER